MNSHILKRLRFHKPRPKAEYNSPAYLEGLPEELVKSEYPMEYSAMRREKTPVPLRKLWIP